MKKEEIFDKVFHSLAFTTKDKQATYNFKYEIIKAKGVKISEITQTENNEPKFTELDILVPFNPNIKFDKMRKSAEKCMFYSIKLKKLAAKWPKKLVKFIKNKDFNIKVMLEKIKDIDMYANLAPIYETMIEKIENNEI